MKSLTRTDVAVAADEADHEEAAGLVGRGLHRRGLRGVHRHRLFAEDVLAGVEGGDGALRVGVVPGADADGVDLGQGGEHLVLVVEDAFLGDPILLRLLLRARLVDVAERVDFDVGVARVAAEVAVADSAASDHGDLDLLVHGLPLGWLKG